MGGAPSSGAVRRALLVCCLLVGLVVAPGADEASWSAASSPGHPPAPPSAATPPAAVALTSGWEFAPDPTDSGGARDWRSGQRGTGWQAVSVPHVFDARPDPALFHGSVGWYRLRFTAPATPAGFGWAVSFEQVRRHALVWLNGAPVGGHDDPYTPFALPLAGLRPGANTLVVRVDNRKGTEPREGWWNWGGITRPVRLIPRGPVVLDDLGLLSQLRCDAGGSCPSASVLLDGRLTNRSGHRLTPRISVALRPPGPGPTTKATQTLGALAPGASAPVRFTIPVAGHPAPWAPGHPRLYAATVATDAGPVPAQVDRLALGLRSVSVRAGRLHLNGRRVSLYGAAIQEDVPGRGPALTDGDMDTIVAQLRAVHATVTRAHYLLNPGLLDRLDRAGIMVWSQAPLYHRDALLRTPAQRAVALDTLRGTVLAARSHPSVLTHSVANELSPTPDSVPGTRTYLEASVRLVHQLDPTLPVALDLLSYPGFAPQRTYRDFDVLGINNYFGWYAGQRQHSTARIEDLAPYLRLMHARYPEQAMVMTEFGAEANVAGPASVKQTYAFQSNYIRQTLGIVDALGFMNGAIYWTLREFAVKPHWDGGAHRHDIVHDSIHHKGLIAYDGQRKPAWAMASSLLAAQPLYPASPVLTPRGPRAWAPVASWALLIALVFGVCLALVVSLWSFSGIWGAEPRSLPRAPRPRRPDTTYA